MPNQNQFPFHVAVLLLLVSACKAFIVSKGTRVVLPRGITTVLVGHPHIPDSFRNDSRWRNFFHRICSKVSHRRKIKYEARVPIYHQEIATPRPTTSKRQRLLPQISKRKQLAQLLCIACTLIALSPVFPGDIAPVHQGAVQSRPTPIVRVLDRTASASIQPVVLARNTASVTNNLDGSRLMAELSSRGSGSPSAMEARETTFLSKENALLKPKESLREYDSKVPKINSPILSGAEKRHAVLSFVTDAVEKVGPSVLRIDTETPLSMGESDVAPSADYIQQGQGSGVIFSNDGLVLTNAHVVEDASKVTVTLTDGRVFEAVVCGADEIVDIAVLKILPNDKRKITPPLPVADLGDSDILKVGQIVVAVGCPGGLDSTVTMGIVSGLERSSTLVGIPHKKVDYIQTDAAINPGNSGGPLCDVETGQVVGINAAIRAHMEGTSFAIPINRVREIMYDLAEGKEISHGYLGISLATCTPEWARKNNAVPNTPKIPEIHGALVHKVFRYTPGEKGGLRSNDILVEISGKRIRSADDARKLIDAAQVDKDLELRVHRDGKYVNVTVQPSDLGTRLREARQERQKQLLRERARSREYAPFGGFQ